MSFLERYPRVGRFAVAVAAGGALFGVATAVQADIPDAGTIHGCYGKPGTPQRGELRVVDSSAGEACRSHESPLTWAQAGPTGGRGPTGPTGGTGPTGPSDAFAHRDSNAVARQVSNTGFTKIESVTVPAGNYVVSAAVGLSNENSQSHEPAICYAAKGPNLLDPAFRIEILPSTDATLPITSDVQFTVQTEIAIYCTALTTDIVTGDATMTATRVGSLTES